MRVGHPAVVGPAHEEIANVDDKSFGIGFDGDPVPIFGKHLQPAWNALSIEDGEHAIIAVRSGTQLPRLGRARLLCIKVQAHRGDVPVNLVVEKTLFDVERKCGESQHERGQLLHFRIVSLSRIRKALRLARPQIRYEIIPAFGPRIVWLVRPAFPAEMIELLEVGWRRRAGFRMRQRLESLCAITPRRAGNGMNCVTLLLQRQSEEGVRLRPQLIHCRDGHAVTGNGEESDLTAGCVDLAGDGLPGCKPAAARRRKVDYRDLLHVLLAVNIVLSGRTPYRPLPRFARG